MAYPSSKFIRFPNGVKMMLTGNSQKIRAFLWVQTGPSTKMFYCSYSSKVYLDNYLPGVKNV